MSVSFVLSESSFPPFGLSESIFFGVVDPFGNFVPNAQAFSISSSETFSTVVVDAMISN